MRPYPGKIAPARGRLWFRFGAYSIMNGVRLEIANGARSGAPPSPHAALKVPAMKPKVYYQPG